RAGEPVSLLFYPNYALRFREERPHLRPEIFKTRADDLAASSEQLSHAPESRSDDWTLEQHGFVSGPAPALMKERHGDDHRGGAKQAEIVAVRKVEVDGRNVRQPLS